MAHITKSKRLKQLLGRADQVLWALLFGVAVPTAIVEALITGLLAYGHFTILESPVHGLIYLFDAVNALALWSMFFFMLWTVVSPIPTTRCLLAYSPLTPTPPAQWLLVAFFLAACDDISLSFYTPWSMRADMESAARRFQVFNALLLRNCHATSVWFVTLIPHLLLMYFAEAWRISEDGGLEGPTFFVIRRIQVTSVVISTLLAMTIG